MNPHISTEYCVNRLFKTWLKNPRLIIAVDFDDTLKAFHPVEHKEDEDYSDVFKILQRAKTHNFYIVLFTASVPERHSMMLDYCAKNDLQIDSINCNPIPLRDGNNGKIYYNLLIDDKSGMGQAMEILAETMNRIDATKTP